MYINCVNTSNYVNCMPIFLLCVFSRLRKPEFQFYLSVHRICSHSTPLTFLPKQEQITRQNTLFANLKRRTILVHISLSQISQIHELLMIQSCINQYHDRFSTFYVSSLSFCDCGLDFPLKVLFCQPCQQLKLFEINFQRLFCVARHFTTNPFSHLFNILNTAYSGWSINKNLNHTKASDTHLHLIELSAK